MGSICGRSDQKYTNNNNNIQNVDDVSPIRIKVTKQSKIERNKTRVDKTDREHALVFDVVTEAIDTQVEHFVSPSAPLVSIITHRDIENVRSAWSKISDSTNLSNKTSLVDFVETFYFILGRRDQSFKRYFKNMSERSVVLSKALTFIVSWQNRDERLLQQKYLSLAQLHIKMGIPLRLFSVYAECILQAVAEILKDTASQEVMSSFVLIATTVVRRFLCQLLKDKKITIKCAKGRTWFFFVYFFCLEIIAPSPFAS
jgi:hemoglobin-like flavoprotein